MSEPQLPSQVMQLLSDANKRPANKQTCPLALNPLDQVLFGQHSAARTQQPTKSLCFVGRKSTVFLTRLRLSIWSCLLLFCWPDFQHSTQVVACVLSHISAVQNHHKHSCFGQLESRIGEPAVRSGNLRVVAHVHVSVPKSASVRDRI